MTRVDLSFQLFTIQSRLLTTLKKRAFWKTLLEWEKMLVTSIFSFSHSVFYSSTLSRREITILASFNLSSANAFNFENSKILSFSKELKNRSHEEYSIESLQKEQTLERHNFETLYFLNTWFTR